MSNHPDLDNRCVSGLYELEGVRASWIFIMTSPVYWLWYGGHTQVRLSGLQELGREEGGSELIAHIPDIKESAGSKWNESGFRPPLCTYRLNWARRTSWGWWDDWDDTVLQTQDSKFEPWRSEAEYATSRSRCLPTILTFTRGWGRNNLVSFKPPRPGTESRTLAWKAAVLTTTLGPPPLLVADNWIDEDGV